MHKDKCCSATFFRRTCLGGHESLGRNSNNPEKNRLFKMTKTWTLTLATEEDYGFFTRKLDKMGAVIVKLFL